MRAEDVMDISPIVPVISIDDENDALPLAEALEKGGINIMEITLRTPAGLRAIESVSKEFPKMKVAAGTVCNEKDLINARIAGAQCIFSPGISQEIIDVSKEYDIPLIPGVSTPSEVMIAKNNKIHFVKFYPAVLSGGIEMLKTFQGPFPKMKFCPTGGINLDNIGDFLALENVPCIGGSWIVSRELIQNKEFDKITKLCLEAKAKISN